MSRNCDLPICAYCNSKAKKHKLEQAVIYFAKHAVYKFAKMEDYIGLKNAVKKLLAYEKKAK